MNQNTDQHIAEVLLLFYFDLGELVDFSEAEIRLISVAGVTDVSDVPDVPDIPDDEHRDKKRRYMELALQRLEQEPKGDFFTVADQRGKKKRQFPEENERE